MKHIDHEVTATLNSLDNVERVAADPFFYTRLRQKMRNRNEDSYYGKVMPVLAVALALFIAINLVSFLQQGGRQSSTGIESFANEYNLSDNQPF